LVIAESSCFIIISCMDRSKPGKYPRIVWQSTVKRPKPFCRLINFQAARKKVMHQKLVRKQENKDLRKREESGDWWHEENSHSYEFLTDMMALLRKEVVAAQGLGESAHIVDTHK